MAFQWSLAALETLMAEDQMDQHAAVLRASSVVELWRLRRVCRAFHRWGTAALAAQPRVVAIGGTGADGRELAAVEVLDLSTLQWSSGVVPSVPEPRRSLSACCFPDGRGVVVMGGYGQEKTAQQWVPGATGWAPLPDMAEVRRHFAVVVLLDGRAMVIGGQWGGAGNAMSSAEVLAADGSGWSTLAPTGAGRNNAAAAVLPCGKVLVAGGFGRVRAPLKTAELWDPATGAWSDLPPMAEGRWCAGCCVLPSGRVAVVGGMTDNYRGRRECELFDPEARTWQPLPPMAYGRSAHGLVRVAGGMLAVGGEEDEDEEDEDRHVPNELFDEVSGRWFELPHPMAEPRSEAVVVSLPAAAMAAPAAAAAVAPPANAAA
eukprot:COSAG04_NODE_1693_length_5912_cov_5.083606_2_plen_374_part_00